MRRLIVLALLLPSLAQAQSVADKRAAIDAMLNALRTAPDEQIAKKLEERIVRAWVSASTPAVTLLMSKGLREMKGKNEDAAIAAFSDAILLDPTLADAWYERGVTRFQSGDLKGCLTDLQQTLKLEPRHFQAWRTLSGMAETREDWTAAYEAWGHVMDIDPRTPTGEQHLLELKKKALGDKT